MQVLRNVTEKLVWDSNCYSGVEFDGRYEDFTIEFELSSYAWNKIQNDKRSTIEFDINKDTDLRKYSNVVGLTKLLKRMKLLCERGYLINCEGSVLVYPASPSRFYMSVVYVKANTAF